MTTHHQLLEAQAHIRAHRIASVAAEELIRCEFESTDTDTYRVHWSKDDEHMRDCIAHLCWHGLAASHETDDGYTVVIFGDFTIGGGE